MAPPEASDIEVRQVSPEDVGGGRWAVDDGWPGVGGKVRHKRRTNRKCPSKSTKNKEMLHNESIKLESPCPAPHRHF